TELRVRALNASPSRFAKAGQIVWRLAAQAAAFVHRPEEDSCLVEVQRNEKDFLPVDFPRDRVKKLAVAQTLDVLRIGFAAFDSVETGRRDAFGPTQPFRYLCELLPRAMWRGFLDCRCSGWCGPLRR